MRRYTDLVNQWQILACVEGGVAAPLVAPFKPRDADLFAIVSGFDAAYSGYGDFQSNMERYWCLRWLEQEQARQVEAAVLKDEILRLADIPLIIKLPGMQQLARGTQVKLDIIRWDEIDLTVEARLLEVCAAPGAEALQQEPDEDEISEELDAAMDMPHEVVEVPVEAAVETAVETASADQADHEGAPVAELGDSIQETKPLAE